MDIQFSFRNTNPATPDQICWSGFLVGLSETFITIPWLPWGERGNLEEERNLGFLLKEWYSCSHFESFPEKVSVSQLCLTLCDPAGCSPPGSSVHGTFQARIQEWVALSFSRDWTCICSISHVGRCILYHCATWEAPHLYEHLTTFILILCFTPLFKMFATVR